MLAVGRPAIPAAITAKLARLQTGAPPRVLDLFAGCGGISLGFHRGGFQIAAAIELDREASASHALNFAGRDGQHAEPRDITSIQPDELVRDLALGASPGESIDVIVGGPPCQAFARVGRAKLREIAEHPTAFLQDPRGNLYLQYLNYVEAFKPLALLMENVPDVLNYGGHNVAEEVCEVLEAKGYRARYTMLNAALYGVPQMRERMFLLAIREELALEPTFPRPTHWIDLPRGYTGSRQVALKSLESRLLTNASHYVNPPAADPQLPAAVTAREAIGDLASLTAHLHGESRRGTRHFDTLYRYRRSRPSQFARAMREWPDFEADGVWDHVIRHLPRDYELFRVMNPGDQYPEAHAHAIGLFRQRIAEIQALTGHCVKEESGEWQQLRSEIVPPYDAGKFPNKWRKMEPDAPARTLMAHLGKDSYSHIHYESSQARTISVREAARLQSFPDGFRFAGKMNSAFRQIGNAVPPLMAHAIAIEVKRALDEGLDIEQPR